jgi:hypothetical protein
MSFKIPISICNVNEQATYKKSGLLQALAVDPLNQSLSINLFTPSGKPGLVNARIQLKR